MKQMIRSALKHAQKQAAGRAEGDKSHHQHHHRPSSSELLRHAVDVMQACESFSVNDPELPREVGALLLAASRAQGKKAREEGSENADAFGLGSLDLDRLVTLAGAQQRAGGTRAQRREVVEAAAAAALRAFGSAAAAGGGEGAISDAPPATLVRAFRVFAEALLAGGEGEATAAGAGGACEAQLQLLAAVAESLELEFRDELLEGRPSSLPEAERLALAETVSRVLPAAGRLEGAVAGLNALRDALLREYEL